MDRAQQLWTAFAGIALVTAVFAGWRERARKRRADLNRVGLVAWPTVQMVALLMVAVGVGLAINI